MTNGYNVFVYGTLLLPNIMETVTGRSFESLPATLEGYKRRKVKNEVFPGIAADPESSTKGKLYQNIDARTLKVLDAFEGNLFDRRVLPVSGENGERYNAYVYVIPDWHLNHLEEEPWSLKTFMQDDYEAFMADIT